MYVAMTHGIRVSVAPSFSPARSDPEAGRWFWTYQVTIENLSSAAVQLLARHWKIVDGDGTQETVDGAGVVGEQPIIAPGSSYTYQSGCPLRTPSGMMSGHYRMVSADGDRITVAIPGFSLDVPKAKRTLN